MRRPAASRRLFARLAAGEGLADLEEREVGEAARLVAGGGAQQAGQEVRAQVAHLRADRVLEPHRLVAAAEERRRLAVDEAVGDAFVEAERGDAAPGLALAALHRRQHRPRHPGRARERPALEPAQRGDAGDLLDEIRLALHVRPPGRHRDLTIAADAEAERRRGCAPARLGDRHADEALHPRGVETDSCARCPGTAPATSTLGSLAAAEIEDHPRGELHPERRERRDRRRARSGSGHRS